MWFDCCMYRNNIVPGTKDRILFKNNHIRRENKFYESNMTGVVEGLLAMW